MRVEALVATMHQNDYSVLDSLNIQSDAVVINQCDREGRYEFLYKNNNILWIDTKERGLSRSRNLALDNATADVCLICDEDETLRDGYPQMIISAFDNLPSADLIVFNINRIGWNETEKVFDKPSIVGRFKTYGSVHITFKLKPIKEHLIRFDTKFGAGSGMYSCAEDAIFCMDCHKNKLNMYTYPGVLCDVRCDTSTWFAGYNEKYFFDVGAYLSVVFPRLKALMKWYYPIRCIKISNLTAFEMIRWIKAGIKGYRLNSNYETYLMNSKLREKKETSYEKQ